MEDFPPWERDRPTVSQPVKQHTLVRSSAVCWNEFIKSEVLQQNRDCN